MKRLANQLNTGRRKEKESVEASEFRQQKKKKVKNLR
jgi:hypothetical protein